ncbi:MAG: glycoside hydrolase family 30 protein [Bacteroidota bacterium]|nr:glycoside hydrolase family 30 protein [Bacteroidota bacterium]MDP4225772.1 glycoside hydrolase family 30 protein [Bacteroidota bacterium]MDP4272998.1 glycoside hydrolase family 30 protein [Bacteroidota bacterium]
MKKITKILLLAAIAFCWIQTETWGQKSSGFSKKQIKVYTTAENTNLRISENGSLTLQDAQQPIESETWIFVDPAKTFQSIVGIGGALTDAAAETFAKLPKEKQKELLTAYYDPQKGIGYTLARTNINSCDFSSDSYTYVADRDVSLKTFNISHDEKYRIPFIRQAIAAAGGKLTVFASPWSPPAWMKDNNDMLHGGKLLPKYRQTWANYFVKFIHAYEAKGIPVWGITVQNEPMARQTWESCIYTAADERDFIKYYLGPTFKKEGLGNKKIIAWDHNRDLLYQRASVIMSDPKAAQYVWGFGYHWYESWSGGGMQFENLKRTKESFPNKNLLFTEGCAERFKAEDVNNWALGEKYGLSLVNDFNNGTVGWTDWNILLDEKGGPNHVGNYCFAPVHADTNTGKLIYTNSYYYLGHFSKFVRPGAKRITSASNRNQLLTTAFVNTDGKLAVIVMNISDKEMKYNLWISGKSTATVSLPHSISTLIVE